MDKTINKILVLFIAVLLISCSPQVREIPEDEPEIQAPVETTEPETPPETTEVTEEVPVEVPEGWPEYIPIMEGLEIVDVQVSDEENLLLNFESTITLTEIKDFYSAALADNGWIFITNSRELNTDDEYRLNYERDGERLTTLGKTEEGYSSVSLIYFKKARE